MILSKVLSKYQITLPKEAVQTLHLEKGDFLRCEVAKGKVFFSPVVVEEPYSGEELRKFNELYNGPGNRGRVYGTREEALRHLKRLR